MRMDRFILISCGCCFYCYKTAEGWRRRDISGTNRRIIAPFIFSFDEAEKIMGTKVKEDVDA